MKEYVKPQFCVVDLCQNDKIAADETEGGTVYVSANPWWPKA